jgi:hypothetical protein
MQGFKNNGLKILASSKISFQIKLRQKQGHLCRCCQIEVLYIHLIWQHLKSDQFLSFSAGPKFHKKEQFNTKLILKMFLKTFSRFVKNYWW